MIEMFGSAGHDPHAEVRAVLAYGRHARTGTYPGRVTIEWRNRTSRDEYVARHATRPWLVTSITVADIEMAMRDTYSTAGYRVALARHHRKASNGRRTR